MMTGQGRCFERLWLSDEDPQAGMVSPKDGLKNSRTWLRMFPLEVYLSKVRAASRI